jgi:hypothetical protein
VSCDACKRIPVLTRKPCQYCGRLNVEAELALKQLRALDKEESESASLRARLAEAERERADCVRVADVAEALGMLNDIDAGREIIEAARSVRQDANRWADQSVGLSGELRQAREELADWKREAAGYVPTFERGLQELRRSEIDALQQTLRESTACVAALRARLAEAEAEREALIKEADEERVSRYEAQSDLVQAREELAAASDLDKDRRDILQQLHCVLAPELSSATLGRALPDLARQRMTERADFEKCYEDAADLLDVRDRELGKAREELAALREVAEAAKLLCVVPGRAGQFWPAVDAEEAMTERTREIRLQHLRKAVEMCGPIYVQQLDELTATNARLVAALAACVKAARYYEREKPGWCPNDDAHDDAIEAAEQALGRS